MPRIGGEAGSAEGFGELGVVSEPGRVDGNVTVCGVWRHCEVGVAGVEVDGLRADEDDRVPPLAEGL